MRFFSCIAVALLIGSFLSANAMAQSASRNKPGIVGKPAPEWKTSAWHQLPAGKKKLSVEDFKGKVVYLYFFQSWCPGCHKYGFPTLKKVHHAFKDDSAVAFAAIQTTFEGHGTNTADKLKEMSKRYDLTIPFGQSEGKSGTPDIMKKYRTGGTPWVVIIDGQGRVRFNDFHIKPADAIAGIKQLKKTVSASSEKSSKKG